MNNQRSWIALKNSGILLPEITSLEMYEHKYQQNRIKVDKSLTDIDEPFLKTKHIIQLHQQLFDGITHSAGNITSKQMGFGGFIGSPPKNISWEFKSLDHRMDALWAAAKDEAAKLRAIAIQHSSLIAIHGFDDGNGRVSRIALQYAIDDLYPENRNTNFLSKKII